MLLADYFEACVFFKKNDKLALMMTCNHLFYRKETRRVIDSKNYSSSLRWIEAKLRLQV